MAEPLKDSGYIQTQEQHQGAGGWGSCLDNEFIYRSDQTVYKAVRDTQSGIVDPLENPV